MVVPACMEGTFVSASDVAAQMVVTALNIIAQALIRRSLQINHDHRTHFRHGGQMPARQGD
jgi:hypothetical protein